jgi:broad-specificity NMP kinase
LQFALQKYVLQQTPNTSFQLMQDKTLDIIILRGCPGSGKSQTAKSLSQSFPKGVRLEVDTIRNMVISVDWKNQQEHIDILQVSTGLVHDFLKLGFSPVIVIDTFSGDKINKYLEALYELDKDLSIKIFGLFTTDDELKRRLDLRTNPEFKDFPICKRLNDDVIKWKHKSEFQVDTTGLSPTQTAEKIYGQINSEKNASR